MYREKIKFISNKLKRDNVLDFRLYNVLYTITFRNNLFEINQFGLDRIHTYPTLNDLFCGFTIYGSTLMECISDIKIC